MRLRCERPFLLSCYVFAVLFSIQRTAGYIESRSKDKEDAQIGSDVNVGSWLRVFVGMLSTAHAVSCDQGAVVRYLTGNIGTARLTPTSPQTDQFGKPNFRSTPAQYFLLGGGDLLLSLLFALLLPVLDGSKAIDLFPPVPACLLSLSSFASFCLLPITSAAPVCSISPLSQSDARLLPCSSVK